MFKFLLKTLFREVKKANRSSQRNERKTNRTYEYQSVSYQSETISTNLPKASVEHVIDGDTVIVKQGWSELRLRLYGIDCPEDGQPWGDIATAGLIKIVGGRDVYLETHGTDKHERVLATIYVWNGKELMNANERMVMLGHAWVMRKWCDALSQDRQDKLIQLERWARSKRVGLWKTDKPIPPWLWRKTDGENE